MTERTVKVRLQADIEGYRKAMREADRATAKAATDIDRHGNKITSTTARMVRSAEVNREAWNTAGVSLTAFGTAGALALGMSAKAALDWETAWTGVLKTVDGTPQQLAQLEDSLRGMALELPASAAEIAAVAEQAGQLGVQVDNVAAFTRTMVDLGETTNLEASEAATALARFMNVMGTAPARVRDLGNVIVELGNNFATTEAETVEFASRLAAAGRQADLSEADVLGFSAALSSVGVGAEAGGTAMSKVFVAISDAVKDGGEDLETFARVAGMSAEEFQRAYEEDAATAIASFVAGMGEMSNAGESTTNTFEELGLTDERLKRSVLSLGSAHEVLTDALESANAEVENGSALAEEAAKRYDTTEAKIQIAKNAINEVGIEIGGHLLPLLADLAEDVASVAAWFGDLPAGTQKAVVGIGGVTAAVSLASGAFFLMFPRVMDTVRGFQQLRASSNPLARGLGSVGKAAGVAGLAVGVLAGVKEAVVALADSTRDMADVRNDLIGIASGAASISGPLNDAVTSGRTFNELMDDLTSAKFTRDNPWESNFFATLFNGMDDAYQELDQFDQAIGEVATIDLDAAREQFLALGRQVGAVSDDQFSRLLDVMPEVRAAFLDSATAAGENLDEAELLAYALGDLDIAQSNAAIAADGTTVAWEDATGAADDLVTSIEDIIDAQREAAGVTLDARSASRNYEQALDDARNAIEENGATLDTNTQKGRDNEAALDDLASSIWDNIDAMEANGTSASELKGKMATAREEFIRTARQAGLSADKAEDLADELNLIPSRVTSTVSVDTSNATARLNALRTKINSMPNSYKGPIAYGTFAAGGAIHGPGTSTSDSVPILASDGEYMQRAAAHEFWGTRTMDALNNLDVHGVWSALAAKGLAGGGPVSPVTPSMYATPSVTVSPSLGDVVARMSPNDIQELAGAMTSASRRIARGEIDAVGSDVSGGMR